MATSTASASRVSSRATTRAGPSSRPRACRTRTPSFCNRRAMSSLWAWASALTRAFTRARSTQHARIVAELVGALDVRHQLGGGDQGLRRHAVGEDGRPADPVSVDHGDLGSELRRDQRGLVAAGPAADDDNVVGHVEVDHVAGDPLDGLLHRLRERGARRRCGPPRRRSGPTSGPASGRAEQAGVACGPIRCAPDDLVVRGVGDDLHEAGGLGHAACLA